MKLISMGYPYVGICWMIYEENIGIRKCGRSAAKVRVWPGNGIIQWIPIESYPLSFIPQFFSLAVPRCSFRNCTNYC
jgi:hypothetical protein